MKLLELPIEMILHMIDFIIEKDPLRSRFPENIKNLCKLDLISMELSNHPLFHQHLDNYWEIILLHFVHITLDKNGKVNDAKSGTEFSTVGFEANFNPIKEREMCKMCFFTINSIEKLKFKAFRIQLLHDLSESSKPVLETYNLLRVFTEETSSVNFGKSYMMQVVRTAQNNYVTYDRKFTTNFCKKLNFKNSRKKNKFFCNLSKNIEITF